MIKPLLTKIYRCLLYFLCAARLCAVILSLSALDAYANINFITENVESIDHFRAVPIHLANNKQQPFTRQTEHDNQGYLWSSGNMGLLRYDGYENKHFEFESDTSGNMPGHPFLHIDANDNIWIGDTHLYLFNPQTETFSAFTVSQGERINAMVEDTDGNFWMGGFFAGIIKFNPKTKVAYPISFDNAPIEGVKGTQSMVFDKSNNVIWVVSRKGVHKYDINKNELLKVPTYIDDYLSSIYIRDIAIDEVRNGLWIGSSKGLLRIDTQTTQVKRFVADGKQGSLPVSDVNVAFLDSKNNLWLGLEKEGLCSFHHVKETFICLRSAVDEKNKLPFATIEHISEDPNGSLWLTMNKFGVYRISPDLEKFEDLRNTISGDDSGFFPNAINGLVTHNGDIWMATDGGGINIINTKTGQLSVIKHDPTDPSSLSSNSVISIAQDENGYVWVGTWAGGISRIDPNTLAVKRYLHSPNLSDEETLAGDNIFTVLPDMNGGLWINAWGRGLQYLNINTGEYTPFFEKIGDQIRGKINIEIVSLDIYDNQIWVAGEVGLEVLDIETMTLKRVLSAQSEGFTHVNVVSLDEVWIGTSGGLIKYNSVTGGTTAYTEENGLSDKEVTYVAKDETGQIWVATVDGLTVINEEKNTFTNFSKQDGLTGNRFSSFSNFFRHNGLYYAPGKDGTSIINPRDMPNNHYSPKTIITSIDVVNTDSFTIEEATRTNFARDNSKIEIPIDANSLSFKFTALNSFVFPQSNRFRYRLKGWQSNFVETSANERVAMYTNLPAGRYTFEVFSSNSSGIWDEQGDQFSFEILPAWWTTWWAIIMFIVATVLSIYLFYKWRFSLTQIAQQNLERKVTEKTIQLQTYASELKRTSESLHELNSELETRVENRTVELQKEVNERKTAESKLFHLAFHDSLTGLPNREKIIQLIKTLLERCTKEPDFIFGVMFLDGDRFKQINDTLGHIFGDELLKAVSARLVSVIGDTQQAGRLGGDEFTVIAQGFDDIKLEALAKKIVDNFKKPFTLGKHNVFFNVSVGIVKVDSTYSNITEVLVSADIAMYRAKEMGKGTYQLFDEQMQKTAIESAALEASLHVALKENQLYLMYQPIVNLTSGLIEGFEALVRWEHPEHGVVPPSTFIPIAEETGLIWDIGKWVLQEACEQTKRWHDMNLGIMPTMAINLSTNQLRNADFLKTLDGIIQQSGIDSKYLKLELTESVLIENNYNLSLLYESLHERQIDLAIDDFGTGYSSLAYLNEIPVQFLKIDRCFIDAIDKHSNAKDNQDAIEIVKATISLAKSLRKQVVAEGIETEKQLAVLIANNCDFAQGYFLSRPLMAEKAQAALNLDQNDNGKGISINKTHYENSYLKRK